MREPEVGEVIYLPSSSFFWSEPEDFVGGLAEIIKVSRCPMAAPPNRIFIETAERPGDEYNWEILLERQNELREQFGTARAHSLPELKEEE